MGLPLVMRQPEAIAQTPLQTQAQSDLFYTFYGQQIPLSLRSNVVAVSFRESTRTRGSRTPLHVQLQQDLRNESRTRSSTRSNNSETENTAEIDVQPLGDRHAIVTVPSGSRSLDSLDQQIRQQDYVEDTLPVLALQDVSNEETSNLVLPNEIILSFEPGLSNSQTQLLFNRHGLEVIRPLQFTENRYLVRSRTERGTAILNVANRLNGVSGIQSATPNFIQSLAYRVQEADIQTAMQPNLPNAIAHLQQLLASLPTLNTPFQSDLLPLSWHLNSTPRRGSLLPRTDVRATEAWDLSNGGEGVVVAVIDSVIQWDHPDLIENLHEVGDRPNLLPGEQHGWDFTSSQVVCSTNQTDFCLAGDPDTRLSAEELNVLRPHFQNTFQLSSQDLLQEYAQLADRLRLFYPHLSDNQLAALIRNIIRHEISAEFHGTWSAGVIAAQPVNGEGAIGVAPNAKILPVRVFGLGGEITAARLIEAIGYAADRGAEVINLSLGGLLPDQDLSNQIFQVLDEYPNVVIVASAGNESLDGVSFPAATPGVMSVGATNLDGQRTFYSSYGGRLDVVAPGGETTSVASGGILTTGGTWIDGFWQGIEPPDYAWASTLDPVGQYVQVQGTSFSAPTVSGVVALMKGVNPNLERDRLLHTLKTTASYDGLTLSQSDLNHYRLQSEIGLTLWQDRLSGIFPFPRPISAEQYFFGNGLVNAEAAVQAARRR